MSTKLLSFAPRGLRAERAAEYVGMGKTKFLELVEDRKMPDPVEIEGVKVWDRLELDDAFEEFKKAGKRVNSFDAIIGSKTHQ